MADVSLRPRHLGPVRCRNCAAELAHWDGAKIKIRVPHKMLVVLDDGRVRMTCPTCEQETDLPVRFTFVVQSLAASVDQAS
jgi:RNase P subunit RPR2